MDLSHTPIMTLLQVCIALLLVALNAFFVAAEFAIVKVRRTRLEELSGKGVKAARISLLCVDQLDEYLSATQLGITLVSLGLGWIGESAFYNALTLIIPEAEITGRLHLVAAVFSFFVITTLHVVLGELVPKSLAIQASEKMTLLVAKPLRLFYRVARPLIMLFTSMANLTIRLLGYSNMEEPPLSEEELRLVMKESKEDGVISESEAQIISRAFSFSDKRVSDIMIHADEVDFLSLDRSIDDNLVVARRNMHTRLPLTRGTLNEVVGIVHMKDALHLMMHNRSNSVFESCARPPLFVEPSQRQDQLMKRFKERRLHMAIVHNPKTGESLGIVTLEDVLEGVVGEILDEHGN